MGGDGRTGGHNKQQPTHLFLFELSTFDQIAVKRQLTRRLGRLLWQSQFSELSCILKIGILSTQQGLKRSLTLTIHEIMQGFDLGVLTKTARPPSPTPCPAFSLKMARPQWQWVNGVVKMWQHGEEGQHFAKIRLENIYKVYKSPWCLD